MPTQQSWWCDICDEPITAARRGIVVWRSENDRYVDFVVAHKTLHTDTNPRNCDPGSMSNYIYNLDIPHFLGADGLAMMLAWLAPGPLSGAKNANRVGDLDAFVDLVRRFQTPHYEEARRLFTVGRVAASLADANEYFPYLPETLKRIVDGDV